MSGARAPASAESLAKERTKRRRRVAGVTDGGALGVGCSDGEALVKGVISRDGVGAEVGDTSGRWDVEGIAPSDGVDEGVGVSDGDGGTQAVMTTPPLVPDEPLVVDCGMNDVADHDVTYDESAKELPPPPPA